MEDRKSTCAKSKPIFSNSQMNTQQIRTFCELSPDAERLHSVPHPIQYRTLDHSYWA